MRLIDADALAIDFYDEYETEDDVYAYGYVSKHQIDEAPTIDAVSVVRGEWKDKGRHLWECSNCKMMIYSESEQDRSEFHKWCSRCGARMKGADDE